LSLTNPKDELKLQHAYIDGILRDKDDWHLKVRCCGRTYVILPEHINNIIFVDDDKEEHICTELTTEFDKLLLRIYENIQTLPLPQCLEDVLRKYYLKVKRYELNYYELVEETNRMKDEFLSRLCEIY
jgi:hypothetical protein